MLPVPSSQPELIAFAHDLIEQCRVSVGQRSAYYRLLNAVSETGRYDGWKSLINMLHSHLERTAAHLFSPIELKFAIDYERPRSTVDLERAKQVAKVLTRQWDRNNIDMTFGRGVFEGLKYGACILKQWPQMESWGGTAELPVYYDKLVQPWQFGVYREDENHIERQEALCETQLLTEPEIWARIYHMPDARKLMERIRSHMHQGQAANEPTSFFHQVLSSSQLSTTADVQSATRPGGIVQMGYDPQYMVMGPTIGPSVVPLHVLWVKHATDSTTVQLIEPDIIVAPRYKKANLLGIPRQQPYRLIQPNQTTNWFWGRSELVDLIEPQMLLSIWADDVKRLFGLQVDKILGFTGEAGIDDERYAQFRNAGYLNLPAGADIKDVTPKMPPEAIAMLKFAIEIINTLGGFPEIMQGKGEPGVRAGVHANTLLKTGSPTLRDRSLLVERQCESAADLSLQMMEAKDPQRYWLKADNPIKDVEETSFLLADLPDDWRVTVDSHSSSPIFADENSQLISQGAKAGYVDGEYVIDNLPFPDKERAKARLRE